MTVSGGKMSTEPGSSEARGAQEAFLNSYFLSKTLEQDLRGESRVPPSKGISAVGG